MEEFKDEINLGESVVKVLKGIYDPEIPVDIYELGLIYDVMINEDNEVKVLMTLTSPNCPVAETLPREVEEKVQKIETIKSLLHGGSKVISTSHDLMASIFCTFSSTSRGKVSATGHFGEVNVIKTFTSLSSLIITS